MRSVMILLPFLIFLGATRCRAADAPKKPTERRSYVMATEGIVGGFVPARVRQRILVIDSGEDFAMLVMKHPVRNTEATYYEATLTKADYAALMERLAEQGLWTLPVEVPAGCQDIYKMDTSIAVSADKKFWCNGGPSGCVHGVSKVQPGKEDQEKFRKIAAMLKELADKHAKTKGDAKSFHAAVAVVLSDGASRGTKGGTGGGTPSAEDSANSSDTRRTTVTDTSSDTGTITRRADLDKHVGETVTIRGVLKDGKLPTVLGVMVPWSDRKLLGREVEVTGVLNRNTVKLHQPIQLGPGTYDYILQQANGQEATVRPVVSEESQGAEM